MNTLIGIWSLVFGGVALPGADPSLEYPISPWIRPPTAEMRYPDLGPAGGAARTPSPSGTRGQAQGGTYGQAGLARPQPGYGRQGTALESQIPAVPTDPLAITPDAYPFAPPTANLQTQQGGSGGPSSGAAGTRAGMIPQAPASPLPRKMPSMPRSRTTEFFRSRALSYGTPVSMDKPFSGHQADPVLSPYMDLFRTDNSLGTVDNYNQYVRPKLQQQARNRQLNRQVRGLQSTTQRQGSALRQSQQLQGLSAPQYYQNYGGYYPGFGR
jgi:hypothetical protein